jgi:hypothetical protein
MLWLETPKNGYIGGCKTMQRGGKNQISWRRRRTGWIGGPAFIAGMMLASAGGPRALAVTYLQEGFNYTPGNLGANAPWINSSSLISVNSSGLTYPSLMDFSPSAKSVTVSQGTKVVTYRPLTTTATNGAVYFSFLISFPVVPGNFYIAGLTQSTNASPGGAADDPLDLIDGVYGTGYTLGVRGLGGAANYLTNGSTQLNLNTAYFVVMKYNFTNGSTTMYVNPPPGDTEPATPDAFSPAGAIVTNLAYVYLRVGATNAGDFAISALRVASTWAEATPSTNTATAYSQAAMLSAFLSSLQVDKYWLVGTSVNWFTGASGGSGPNMTIGTDSHCSAFAGAVADLLGVYILRQPYASDINLANNQALWLPTNASGWYAISSMTAAQHAANAGSLVVGSYFNTNGSGHIAILRPSNRTDASVNTFGPEECQSGDYNYADTNVVTGFSVHPGAFPNNIAYYGHAVAYPVSPVTPVFSQDSIGNHVFQTTVNTIYGRKYQSQWSSNLTAWTPLVTFTNSNNSTNFFTNTLITNSVAGQRFYRVLAQ